jgi:hypothetical protein
MNAVTTIPRTFIALNWPLLSLMKSAFVTICMRAAMNRQLRTSSPRFLAEVAAALWYTFGELSFLVADSGYVKEE